MRNIIPIIVVAAAMLAGCHSPTVVQTQPPAPPAPAPTVVTTPVITQTVVTQTVATPTVETQAVVTPTVETQVVATPTMQTQAVAAPAPPAPVEPATVTAIPPDSLSENVMLGDLGAVFILLLTILALSRR
jgi:hypothetical protein